MEGDGEDITNLFVLVEMEPITPPNREAIEPIVDRATALPVEATEPAPASVVPAAAVAPFVPAAEAPLCHACDTLITQGKVISAGGERAYHVDCFVCTTCDEPLQEGQYAEHTDGDIYCQEHYAELAGAGVSVCDHCGEPIAG